MIAGLQWLTASVGLASVVTVSLAANPSPPVSDLNRELVSVKAVCAHCHTLQIVMDTPRSFDEWQTTVQTMVDQGAAGTDAQFDDIMDYLHRTMTTIDINSAPAEQLQRVLDLPEQVALALVARRNTKKFADLADLKSVPGVNETVIDAKARMIFFK